MTKDPMVPGGGESSADGYLRVWDLGVSLGIWVLGIWVFMPFIGYFE
jgi:hypothetical protein